MYVSGVASHSVKVWICDICRSSISMGFEYGVQNSKVGIIWNLWILEKGDFFFLRYVRQFIKLK